MMDRKSTSGLLFQMGRSIVTWGSKKQEIIALSITEAEYVAATAAACQVVWTRRILQDCSIVITESTRLWIDNQSAISVAKNPALHGRTKHIDVRFHFIRSLVAEKVVSLHYCCSEDQLADIFTKPLPVEKHLALREKLGLCMLQSCGVVDG